MNRIPLDSSGDERRRQLIGRALSAYYRQPGWVLPDVLRVNSNDVHQLDGRYYVVIGLIWPGKVGAVYRVRNDGELRRLRRLPGG